MNKITVVGSVNLDTTIRTENFPKPGETIHSKEVFTNGGGKGANQAKFILSHILCLMAQSLGGNNAHYKVVMSPIMTICVAYREIGRASCRERV